MTIAGIILWAAALFNLVIGAASLFQPGAEVRLGVESTQVRFLTH